MASQRLQDTERAHGVPEKSVKKEVNNDMTAMKKIFAVMFAVLCMMTTGCGGKITADTFAKKAQEHGYTVEVADDLEASMDSVCGKLEALVGASNGDSDIGFIQFEEEKGAETMMSMYGMIYGDDDPAKDVIHSEATAFTPQVYLKRIGNTIVMLTGGSDEEFESSRKFLKKIGY